MGRFCAASTLILFLAAPSAAQEQRGQIEGTVKDWSGAVLPGATVEAKPGAGGLGSFGDQ